MRTNKSLLVMIPVMLVLIAVSGCKSSGDYVEERGKKAVTQHLLAQQREIQNGRPLSLDQCIEIALQNNLEVRVYELEQEVAKEFRTAEALGMLPELTLTNNFTARSNTPASSSKKLVTSGESYGASVSEDRNVNYLNIDLMLSMLDFGIAYFNTQQAQDRVFIRKQRTERAVQNLSFDVVRAYFKVAAAQRAIKMTTTLLEQCRSRYQLIEQARQKKQITVPFAYQQATRFIDMEKRLTQFVRSYENACVELRALLGYYPNSNIFVDESVLDRVPDFKLPEISTMEQIALIRRPELYEVDMQRHVNLVECYKTVAMMFPNVKLFVDWSNSNNSYLYNQSWWELGVRAAYNLLKLPQNIQRYRSYRKQVETEEMRSYAQAVAVMAQVRIAYGNLLSAKERYDLNRKVYTTYDENLQAALKSQAVGRATQQLELDHMRLTTTETSIESLMSLGDYYVAYYRLLNVMGLRKLDARSTDEMVEEITDADNRMKDEIAAARKAYDEQRAAAMKEALEKQKLFEAKAAADAAAERRAKVNAQIDKRIEAESANSQIQLEKKK